MQKKTVSGAMMGAFLLIAFGLASPALAQDNSGNSDWKGKSYTFHTTTDKVNDTYTATVGYQAANGGLGSGGTTSVTNINGPINQTTSYNGPVTSTGATNVDQQNQSSSYIQGSNIEATVRNTTSQQNAGATQTAQAQTNGQSSNNNNGK